MRLFLVFATCLFLCSGPGSTFALSEAEYNQLLQTSAKFRQETCKMFEQWDSLQQVIKGEAWNRVVEDQRSWSATTLDSMARKNMAAGYTWEYAYAKATHDRVAELWARERNCTRTPEEIAAGEAVGADMYDDPIGSPYGQYDGITMGVVAKIIPVDGDLSQVHILDSFGHTHIYYISRKDIAARKKKHESVPDPNDCQDPKPRESEQPYLFEILGETATPESARRMGDSNKTIKIISNFNMCYG